MNKKGFAMSKLVGIIVLLILLVVFVMFIIDVNKKSLRMVEDSECKASILTHTILIEASGEALVTDIYCPTKYYTIPKSNEKESKRYIADSLKTCWGTWGRGQIQLFKGEGYFCHICSVIDFNQKNKQIEGLTEYLLTTKVNDEKFNDLTYMDYLTGDIEEKASPEFIQQVQQNTALKVLDSSKTYATMFVYAKGDDYMQDFYEKLNTYYQTKQDAKAWSAYYGSLGGATAGILTAAIIGATGGAAAVVVGAGAVLGAIGGAIIDALKSKGVEWVSMVIFEEYTAENLKQIGCEIMPVRQDKEKEVLG
ncbi:MAG: hypothetical protein KKF46_06475 [Nanoarchaeota archaeon]|nr:hypothetical protein [Nanoarchaeota archaeon]MBU1321974.1 hypothetical protein [Nanoarchaeota archaeon]MBU1598210.1 hypothetical protein [Nanoarchaeota archaeon]MBU2441115.1 hypothetical protein [Nanoarchaeota archaeon]